MSNCVFVRKVLTGNVVDRLSVSETVDEQNDTATEDGQELAWGSVSTTSRSSRTSIDMTGASPSSSSSESFGSDTALTCSSCHYVQVDTLTRSDLDACKRCLQNECSKLGASFVGSESSLSYSSRIPQDIGTMQTGNPSPCNTTDSSYQSEYTF